VRSSIGQAATRTVSTPRVVEQPPFSKRVLFIKYRICQYFRKGVVPNRNCYVTVTGAETALLVKWGVQEPLDQLSTLLKIYRIPENASSGSWNRRGTHSCYPRPGHQIYPPPSRCSAIHHATPILRMPRNLLRGGAAGALDVYTEEKKNVLNIVRIERKNI